MTSISCASSDSTQKTSQIQSDNRSKSCDTVCSSSSSCFFKRRKPMNPLAYPLRTTYHKPNTNSVKQRVMSAKMLKLRQLQSQLNDANYHLAEVARENQTLKTLQKRQDKALSRYENTNADLPRLLHSHEEEIKVLTEKNKNLRKTVKNLAEQLKQKEDELNKAREQLSHLEKLNKDKHLTEREKLKEKMEDVKINLQKSEEQVNSLNRKLMLEMKISKQRLNSEIIKHKQCQKELLHAFDEIDRLSGLLDAKENIVRPRNQKFNKFQNRDSQSMVTLRHYQSTNRNLSNDRLSTLKGGTPVTEVRLEPLPNENKKEVDDMYRRNDNRFKTPMENIKQRLSSGSKTITHDLNGLSTQSAEVSSESRDNSAGSYRSRPNSSFKLEKLPAVEENQRVRRKMNREQENLPDITKEKFGENVISDEENPDERHRNEENADSDKEIIVRYDWNGDSNRLDDEENNIGIQINDEYQFTPKKQQEQTELNAEVDNQSGSESDEELVSIIHKIKEGKEKDPKQLPKIQNNNRKNRNGLSQSINTHDDQKSEEENIEKLTETLDVAIQRVAENSKEEFDKKLGSYCSEVLSSVKKCSKVIQEHKDSLESSKQDTSNLKEALKRTEKVESKLKKSFFNMDDDMDFVREILSEEYKFQAENKNNKSSFLDKNSNIDNKSLVNLDNKKKLLATLRAIDNGDSIDSVEDHKQDNFINERFGHVAH